MRADAEALCEAMSRPTMRFVPVKTAEQQAALMMVALRDRLIRNRTQLSNAIRGYAAECGLTAAKGKADLVPLLEQHPSRRRACRSQPENCFSLQAKEYAQLQVQIDESTQAPAPLPARTSILKPSSVSWGRRSGRNLGPNISYDLALPFSERRS